MLSSSLAGVRPRRKVWRGGDGSSGSEREKMVGREKGVKDKEGKGRDGREKRGGERKRDGEREGGRKRW